MRIMEETVKQDNQFTSCGSAISANERARYELRCDIAEFVNRGGKITEYSATGEAVIKPEFQPKKIPKREMAGEQINSPITVIPYKNRATHKSPHGQNIRKSGDYYWVQIGALELGRGEKWDHETAIQIRDNQRQACNMPPVEY